MGKMHSYIFADTCMHNTFVHISIQIDDVQVKRYLYKNTQHLLCQFMPFVDFKVLNKTTKNFNVINEINEMNIIK